MPEQDVKRFIKQLGDLSTTPAMIGKILSLVNDESRSPAELCDLISYDQALAQRVLRVANSTFFAHSGQVTSIEQAVMFLGMDRIKNIALGMTVMNIFPARGSFHIDQLWLHGYEVAFLSSMLSERVALTQPQDTFLAGLLHDIGRAVLYSMDHEKFELIETTDTMLEQETDLFGCTHAAAGAWFAEELGLPNPVVLALKYHHHPSSAPDEMNLVAVVSLAEALSRMFRPRVEDDGIWTREHDAALLEFSLSPNNIAELGERYRTSLRNIDQFFAS